MYYGFKKVKKVPTYSAFTAGAYDGQVGQTQDDMAYHVYSSILGLWMPEKVRPTSVVISYDGSVLPENDGWTKTGSGIPISTDGDILTINDNSVAGGSYTFYEKDDAINHDSTFNWGVIYKAKLTAVSSSAGLYKSFIGIRPGSLNAGALALAGSASGLSAADQVFPFSFNGNTISGIGATTTSPDHAQYQYWYVLFFAARACGQPSFYRFGTLGNPSKEFVIQQSLFTNATILAGGVFFGNFQSNATSTLLVDYLKTFKFT